VTTLTDRAQTQVHQPEAWKAALDAAFTALRQAETLLTKEPALGTGELREKVRQVRARLEADKKDWQLLAVYDQVRLEQCQWDLQRHRFKLTESYPRLKQALTDYGLAIGGLEVSQAAARLRQRPEAVQPYVRAVLWECLAWVPKKEVGQRQWLVAVLAVEADPWLVQFRQTGAKGAWEKMEQLAGQAEVSRHHPGVLVVLARNLPDAARAGRLVLLRRTQQQYPGDFWVNFALGHELYGGIFPSEEARPARPEELTVVNEALAFYRVAVGLRPGNAPAHNNLGAALKARGNVKEAIECWRKALDLDPKLVEAHNNLGNALADQRDVKGAIECYKRALDIDPKDAYTHINLGVALQAQGDVQGAIACYQTAIDLEPKLAGAHINLGHALRKQGKFVLALEALRRGHELGSKRPGWKYPSEKWVKDCQRLVELDRDLPDILAGKKEPAGPAELVEFAYFGTHQKNRFVEVAELFQRCFRRHPGWMSGSEKLRPRYYAAATAAMAARRVGVGWDWLDEGACWHWRERARLWLRAELDAWAAVQKGGTAAELQALRKAVHYWQKDGWLSGVRDKNALDKLPKPERAAWQQLWTDVAALLKRAEPK
jgi:tetratricopeptide (TPR) repeat protein